MPSVSRPIFLSPHPDDAVLSCGGWIYQLAQDGARPIVMTIFGGDRPGSAPLSAFARSLHQRWQLDDDAPARRRDEDRAACDRLGCYLIQLPFADAVYRVDETGRPRYDSEEAIFAEVRDRELIDRVANAVHSRVERLNSSGSVARLYIPLTAGKHVDHIITRLAAEQLPTELIYYEDYPYAERPEYLTQVWEHTGSTADDWVSETIGLSEGALQAKCEAFGQHRSQISTFFRDDDEVRQRLRAYAEFVGEGQAAERYWRKR